MNVVRLHHCSHLDAYGVESQSTPHLVHVVLHTVVKVHDLPHAGRTTETEWVCGCQWGSSGRVCGHILAAQAFEDHEDEAYDRHREEEG